MTIDELVSSITPLSYAEKIHFVQVVLQQLAQDNPSQPANSVTERFDPRRFHGAAQHSRQEVDHYLTSLREGWN